MTTKDELLHLVDELDETDQAELLDYARWLTVAEDEELTPEELQQVRDGEAAIARGDYVSLEELRRRLPE